MWVNEMRSSPIPISGWKVGQSLVATFALLMLSSCGYADESKEPDIRVSSNNSIEFLAQCVSQDWDSAFPRMFPASSSKNERSFRTYDGILITIRDLNTSRFIEVRTSKSLNSAMIRYLRKCGSNVWWQGHTGEKVQGQPTR